MLSILTTLTLAAAPQAVEPVGSLQLLDVPTDPQGVVTIDVTLDDVPVELVLERHSLRAADFRLYGTAPDGSLIQLPAPQHNTWRGYVDGWSDSQVVATMNDEGLSAVVVDEATELEWQIQPAEGMSAGTYSVALSTEVVAPPGVCGTDGVTMDPVTGGQTAFAGTGLQLCELACDTDFEFFQRNGNSVQATLDDIERVMNRVDTIYVRDCDVTFQLTNIIIRNNPNDPYTTNDAGNLLGQFRSFWNANFNGTRKDLAHLFTGKNLQGGTIGVAFLNAVCNQTLGYGLSESRFTGNLTSRAGLTAHEIGHNFNRNHCNGSSDCRIMCASLGGCAGDVSRFGAAAGAGIRSYAISRGCLFDLTPPLALPVLDEFTSTSLNRDIWISFQGTDINAAANGEPSAPNSIHLSAQNGGDLRDDFLISNYLLLDGLNNVTVSFWSQRRNVPSGSTLDVEILDSSNDWQPLVSLVSDGVTQNTFTFHSAQVPPGAYHDEAQIRIRVDVDGNGQDWHIDDFMIDDNSCGGVTPYCVGAANSASPNGAVLGLNGSTSLSANDLILVTTSCPTMSFGIYIYGDQQTQTVLGNGFLCVTGNPLFRLAIVQADLFGNNVYALDNQNLPPGSVINPGDTLNFQLWYRDSIGAGFNLSNGLEVNFCP
ncbi:MAG: zinc-dependent metalloprotease family protein [Planctomycetota bacterium]